MVNLVELDSSILAPDSLRALANMLEAQGREKEIITVITDNSVVVFGPIVEQFIAQQAAFAMAWGMDHILHAPNEE